MLLHAPRKTASAEAIPRLAAVRAPREPTMFSPKQICGRTRPAAKRKSSCRSNDVHANYAGAPIWFPEASYIRLTKALTPRLLDRIGVKPYPRARNWHSESTIAKMQSRSALGGVEYARIPGPPSMANPTEQTRPPKGTVMAKTKFRPLHDRVVVKRIDAEAKDQGRHHHSRQRQEKPSQGEITAVGPGGRTKPAN